MEDVQDDVSDYYPCFQDSEGNWVDTTLPNRYNCRQYYHCDRGKATNYSCQVIYLSAYQHLPACLPACLSCEPPYLTCLTTHLPACLPACLPAYGTFLTYLPTLPTYLSIYLSYLPTHLPACLPTYLLTYMSAYLYIPTCLSYLPYLPTFLPTHYLITCLPANLLTCT